MSPLSVVLSLGHCLSFSCANIVSEGMPSVLSTSGKNNNNHNTFLLSLLIFILSCVHSFTLNQSINQSINRLINHPQYLVEVAELTLERDHRVSAVRGGNTAEKRNTAGDLVGRKEGKDSKHGKTSVVDLGHKAAGLGLLRHVLAEAKGIVQVQDGVDTVTELGERRVLAGLAALGVVGKLTASALVPKLEHGNDKEDLPLGADRDGVPLGLGGEVSRGVGSSGKGLGPREDKVGLDAVSDKGSHGDTAVLDLGLTEEANGGLIAHVVKVGLGEVHGVIELDNRVGSGGNGLQVGLCHINGQ